MRALSIEAVWQDARHALRAMRQRPSFTAIAVVTLALGIGVNVASFAVTYGILIRPLPYRDPSRVVVLNLLFADGNDLGFSPRALREWLPRLRTVDLAAGYYRREVTVRSGVDSSVVPAALVTDQFFEVLGTPAELGHARVDGDQPEVVVGRRVAAHTLRGDPAAGVGALLSVSDTSRTINGIMEDAIAQSIANRRVRALPAVGFGLLALAVAFVGMLATLSTLVAEQRRDLAIRSAPRHGNS